MKFCCVFSSGVLGTVCGAIGLRRGSQSGVCLRVFERGFGNGLRGNWASEGVAKWCFVEVFERGFGNGLRGIWVSEGEVSCMNAL